MYRYKKFGRGGEKIHFPATSTCQPTISLCISVTESDLVQQVEDNSCFTSLLGRLGDMHSQRARLVT